MCLQLGLDTDGLASGVNVGGGERGGGEVRVAAAHGVGGGSAGGDEAGLFAGGGVPPYRWSHVAGTLPPGLSVQASPGRVLGTPTTAGTFTFTVRVNDNGGQSATQQFTIRVLP